VNNKKPNLFIVGKPRSGTTAMYYYLNQHPDIFMSTPKEPFYFCSDFHEESDRFHGKAIYFPIRTERNYMRCFKGNNNKKVIGEASAVYLSSRVAARNIFYFNPDAKIIMLFREPVEFLCSFHSLMVFDGTEDMNNFKAALLAENERKERYNKISQKAIAPSFLFYTEQIKYFEQLQRFYKYFDKSQIKIIIYDDFRDNNEKIYNEVLNFLGLKTIKLNLRMVNKNKVVRYRFLKNMIDRSAYIKKIKVRLPVAVFNFLINKYDRLIQKEVPKVELNNELKIELKNKFMPEVEKLSEAVGIDLIRKWNYKN